MLKITRDNIFNKKGLENIMSVDLNNSANYVAEQEDFFVEARVAYALMDMGMKPELYIEDGDAYSGDPNEYKFLTSKLGKGHKYGILDLSIENIEKGDMLIDVYEVYPKFHYLLASVFSHIGKFKIKNTRLLKMRATRAEVKRMLLIFDELKYKRNTHIILDFQIPKMKDKGKLKSLDCFES